MLRWLRNIKSSLVNTAQTQTSTQAEIDLAIAVLLVEIIHADHVFDEREAKITVTLLQEQCNITQAQANDVYRKACIILSDAVSLYEYTSRVHSELSYEKKFELMIGLWKIAMADGDIDHYEEHLIRKIAELLYISHKDFIRAKHLVLEQAK